MNVSSCAILCPSVRVQKPEHPRAIRRQERQTWESRIIAEACSTLVDERRRSVLSVMSGSCSSWTAEKIISKISGGMSCMVFAGGLSAALLGQAYMKSSRAPLTLSRVLTPIDRSRTRRACDVCPRRLYRNAASLFLARPKGEDINGIVPLSRRHMRIMVRVGSSSGTRDTQRLRYFVTRRRTV